MDPEEAYQMTKRLRQHVRTSGTDLTGTEFEGNPLFQAIAEETEIMFKAVAARAAQGRV